MAQQGKVNKTAAIITAVLLIGVPMLLANWVCSSDKPDTAVELTKPAIRYTHLGRMQSHENTEVKAYLNEAPTDSAQLAGLAMYLEQQEYDFGKKGRITVSIYSGAKSADSRHYNSNVVYSYFKNHSNNVQIHNFNKRIFDIVTNGFKGDFQYLADATESLRERGIDRCQFSSACFERYSTHSTISFDKYPTSAEKEVDYKSAMDRQFDDSLIKVYSFSEQEWENISMLMPYGCEHVFAQ